MTKMTHLIPQVDATIDSRHQPEFIRLPKNGQCPYTGLSRSKMNQLILPCEDNGFKPPVRSVCLRPKGGFKGTRLIDYQSLLNYLYSRIEEVKV